MAKVVTVLACVTVLLFSALCLLMIPAAKDALEEMDVELPAVTKFFLSVPLVAWVAVGAAACLILIGKGLVIGSARARTMLDGIAIVLALGAIGLLLMATLAPVLQAAE